MTPIDPSAYAPTVMNQDKDIADVFKSYDAHQKSLATLSKSPLRDSLGRTFMNDIQKGAVLQQDINTLHQADRKLANAYKEIMLSGAKLEERPDIMEKANAARQEHADAYSIAHERYKFYNKQGQLEQEHPDLYDASNPDRVAAKEKFLNDFNADPHDPALAANTYDPKKFVGHMTGTKMVTVKSPDPSDPSKSVMHYQKVFDPKEADKAADVLWEQGKVNPDFHYKHVLGMALASAQDIPDYNQLPEDKQKEVVKGIFKQYAISEMKKLNPTVPETKDVVTVKTGSSGGHGGGAADDPSRAYVSPPSGIISDGVVKSDDLIVYLDPKKQISNISFSITPQFKQEFIKANPKVNGQTITSMDAKFANQYKYASNGIFGLVRVTAYEETENGQKPIGNPILMWVKMDKDSPEGANNRGMLKGKVPMPEPALPNALQKAGLSWDNELYRPLMGGYVAAPVNTGGTVKKGATDWSQFKKKH